MKIRSAFLLLAAIAGLSVTASTVLAQVQRANRPAANRPAAARPLVKARLNRLGRALRLTADQRSQLASFLADQRAARRALRADDTASRQDRVTQLRDLRQSRRTEMQTVLTPRQQARLRAARILSARRPLVGIRRLRRVS